MSASLPPLSARSLSLAGGALRSKSALAFSGLKNYVNPNTVMASPPAITVGVNNAVSAITGAANATVSIAPNDSRITYVGGPAAATPTAGYYGVKASANYFRYWSVAFTHVGRRLEFRLRGSNRTSPPLSFAVRVNGELASATLQGGVNGSGTGNQLVLVDFGANAETIQLLNIGVNAGGTGHAVDDVITLAGGTFTTAARVRVMAVSGGVITQAKIEDMGAYSVAPTSPASQGSTTGSGTGAAFGFSRFYVETTQKPRHIELLFAREQYFGGLNVDTGDLVYPWPQALGRQKRLIIGDSITEGTYAYNLDTGFAAQIKRLLDDCETWIFGVSGLGYVGGTAISTFNADLVAMAPLVQRVTLFLGTNDAGQAAGTITTAVTTQLNNLFTANPSLIITVVAGFTNITTTERDAIFAGVAACAYPARCATVDMYNAIQSANMLRSSDGTHPTQNGHDWLARVAAPLVAQAEAGLLG
jgi:lysophospholipase L1-like esterase